jgi:hypothetical protein
VRAIASPANELATSRTTTSIRPIELTDAPAVLDRCVADLERPKLALVLTVREVYGHCAKAFLRAQLWQPESWARVADAPDLVDMYACLHEVDDPDAMRDGLAQSYVADLAHD